MSGARLHWKRGRRETGEGGDAPRTLEWIGYDNAGEPIARVVRVRGPAVQESAPQGAALQGSGTPGRRAPRAVALDEAARVVELRPAPPPDGAGWLACVGSRVVGRAERPLEAVRAVEATLAEE